MKSNGPALEKSVTDTSNTVPALVKYMIPVLTTEHLLPSQRILLIYFRYDPNTRSHCTKVQHWTYLIYDAPLSRLAGSIESLRPRNRAEITILMCKQTPYPVWFSFRRHSDMGIPIPKPLVIWELKQNWMQGWQYGKGLIYFRPKFRLTKSAFLWGRLIFSTLEIRQERTSRFYLRVEWTTAFKGFY